MNFVPFSGSRTETPEVNCQGERTWSVIFCAYSLTNPDRERFFNRKLHEHICHFNNERISLKREGNESCAIPNSFPAAITRPIFWDRNSFFQVPYFKIPPYLRGPEFPSGIRAGRSSSTRSDSPGAGSPGAVLP